MGHMLRARLDGGVAGVLLVVLAPISRVGAAAQRLRRAAREREHAVRMSPDIRAALSYRPRARHRDSGGPVCPDVSVRREHPEDRPIVGPALRRALARAVSFRHSGIGSPNRPDPEGRWH
ncbi:hypothetical protein ACFVT5_23880 [Streptomyces sp. NPDC058001]|uniref:hypothetical protein n=1 Tax=Streptomyces sp. NPDC058001 TaxID=3346300 RepID=UPI0036E460AF